jgi:DNA-binding MarR family transcriptional regulator
MTRILAGLAEAELIVRDVSEHHARVRLARLTDQGRQLVARAHPVVDAAEDRLFAPLSAEQRAELLANMAKCTEALPGDIVFETF